MKRYKKPYRVKRRKSILRNRFFWFFILFLIAAVSISYLLFFSGIFQIKKIIITGDKIFSEENISALITGESIFLINIRDIEDEILRSFPQTAKVKVHRNFPDALDIFAEKRLPTALWCESETCFLIDKDGVIFQQAQNEDDLIKIFGLKDALNKEKIAQILDVIEKLKDGPGIAANKVNIVSRERLDVKTSEGWEIYFNAAADLDWQVQELSLVLEKQISPAKRKNLEYVDLRFSRVFYK